MRTVPAKVSTSGHSRVVAKGHIRMDPEELISKSLWEEEERTLRNKISRYDGHVWIVSFTPVQIVVQSDYTVFDLQDRVIHGFTLTLLVPNDYPNDKRTRPDVVSEPHILYPHVWASGKYCMKISDKVKDTQGYSMASWIDMAIRMARWEEEDIPAVHRANGAIDPGEQARRRKILDTKDAKIKPRRGHTSVEEYRTAKPPVKRNRVTLQTSNLRTK